MVASTEAIALVVSGVLLYATAPASVAVAAALTIGTMALVGMRKKK